MIPGSKVKLIKILSNHTQLRTNEVIGIVKQIPVIDQSFIMTSEPLDKTKDLRYIETSPIKSVEVLEPDLKWVFKTENSTYELELLEF